MALFLQFFNFMKTLIYLLLTLALISCGNSPQGEALKINIKESSLIASTQKVWRVNQTLVVSFLDGDARIKSEVERFSKEWTQYANINFVFYPSLKDVPRKTKVDILISFNKSGNNSYVGTDSLSFSRSDSASMSLSELSKDHINMRKSTILHEFGHALGLHHEHQSINRPFKMNANQAMQYCKDTYGMTDEGCRSNIFAIISKDNIYFSAYDPASIMHYALHDGLFESKVSFRENASLSLLDKIEIAKLYPGRISEKDIISKHQILRNEIDETSSYKNCKINQYVNNEARFNEKGEAVSQQIKTYSFSSIVEGEYNYGFVWEDKEGLLEVMKNTDYCNYNEEELKTLRAMIVKENFKNQTHGNCIIPLNENGTGKSESCSSNFPFQILTLDQKKAVGNSCYPNFSSALQNMKKDTFCNFTKAELEAYEKQKAMEFEASRTYGKCFVENSLNPKYATEDEHPRCSEQRPWHVVLDDGKPVDRFCYSHAFGAIDSMKSLFVCQP